MRMGESGGERERERLTEFTKGTVFLSKEKKWNWSGGLRKGKRQRKECSQKAHRVPVLVRHIIWATTFEFHGIT